MDESLLKNLDALLVTNPTNVRYVTGFVGAAPDEREAYVLLTPSQTFLFTNALYVEQAKKTRATVIEVSREEPFTTLARTLLAASQGESLQSYRLGFEKHNLTVAEYHKIMLEHKNVMLVPTNGRVEELRMIKRDDEIANIKQAAKLTDQCFEYIIGKIKPGVTEGKIAWEIESFIRARGAGVPFSPIVAFGTHSSQPHYSLTSFARHSLANSQESVLRNHDIVLFDFGARINGYCSDMTRVVFVGKPTDEWIKAYETVREAQQAAFAYLDHERSGASADRLARKVIKKAGFPPYLHSLGHGVGLDIHEAPRLTVKKNATLKPNTVVTVEPAIYKEGEYGIRIEDLVVLKEDGVETLSKSEKEMIIL